MASTPHGSVLTFEYDDEDRARVVARSVRPEVGEIDDERSRTRVERDRTILVVRIDADDPVALRAALNTWLSFVDVAERVGTAAAAGTGEL